jgi:hypothetical protein
MPEDSGNLKECGCQLVACGFSPSELRAGRSATSVLTDDGGHRLEESRPPCPLPAGPPNIELRCPVWLGAQLLARKVLAIPSRTNITESQQANPNVAIPIAMNTQTTYSRKM